jgi:uncharacterized protein (TIGR03067 family)
MILREIGMKTIVAVVLGLGLFGCLEVAARTQDKKEDKKEEKKSDKKVDAPILEGKYKLVSGKRNNEVLGDDAKKWDYTITSSTIALWGYPITSNTITIKNPDITFVMFYKLDPTTTPINIDLEILEGPEGTKGAKASGIIEVKGDILKLAYSMEKDKDKDKRPKNFDGKEGNMFEFKKEK